MNCAYQFVWMNQTELMNQDTHRQSSTIFCTYRLHTTLCLQTEAFEKVTANPMLLVKAIIQKTHNGKANKSKESIST